MADSQTETPTEAGEVDDGDGAAEELEEEQETAEGQDDSAGENHPISRGDGGGCSACDIPEDELLVVYNRNLDYPWKGGNPYARVCPECGSQTFTAKSYWESQEVPYVILKDEDTPKPLFACPYDDCSGELVGTPDECPECERHIEWEGGDDGDT